MIDSVLFKFNQQSKEFGINLPRLTKCLHSVLMHEAMLKNRGNFSQACKEIGISRHAGRAYLGMTQKDWVELHGNKYEKESSDR